MSGFVTGFTPAPEGAGKPKAAVGQERPRGGEVRRMFQAIAHRGPWLSGVWEGDGAVLAQNYLRADTRNAPEDSRVPLSDQRGTRICYDGQIGNVESLAAAKGVLPGPFLEERTLLALYRRHGTGMLAYLDDAIFAFVIHDGGRWLAARDLLGIKTLFHGKRDGVLYLASELKSLAPGIEEVYEFPPGRFMDHTGKLTRFDELPSSPPGPPESDPDRMVRTIREIIFNSVRSRVDFSLPTAGLLSGGMDSSVVNGLASWLLKELRGPGARLRTFAIGVGESTDIINARIVAEHLGTDHEELIVDVEDLVAVLPEVVYHLESFDPSLVRSAASNFLITRHAREAGYEVLLSGEGGDEVFCGYTYLKRFPHEELFRRQMECIDFLHNNASLRLDRMNQASSVRVVAPLISGALLRYAMNIPAAYKLRVEGEEKVEKWIFRKAYEPVLPRAITTRIKQEFSQGSGSAGALAAWFEDRISDRELEEARREFPIIRSKEELHYFRLFTGRFGRGRAVDTVGQWVSA
jgi:asparagine synthase (glutamine-hydrolysing)